MHQLFKQEPVDVQLVCYEADTITYLLDDSTERHILLFAEKLGFVIADLNEHIEQGPVDLSLRFDERSLISQIQRTLLSLHTQRIQRRIGNVNSTFLQDKRIDLLEDSYQQSDDVITVCVSICQEYDLGEPHVAQVFVCRSNTYQLHQILIDQVLQKFLGICTNSIDRFTRQLEQCLDTFVANGLYTTGS